MSLFHLCDFIEDCEFTALSTQILSLVGELGPSTSAPARYIRFIYNRYVHTCGPRNSRNKLKQIELLLYFTTGSDLHCCNSVFTDEIHDAQLSMWQEGESKSQLHIKPEQVTCHDRP